MRIESKHKATKVDIPDIENQFLTQAVLDLHDVFNCKEFPGEIEAPVCLASLCNLVYKSFGKSNPCIVDVPLEHKSINGDDNRDVLLGFSSGLDSVYQAMLLKEAGYNVHLMFAKNINSYENGQAWKYAPQIANKLGLDLMSINVVKNKSKDVIANPFKQHWPENPVKNELLIAVMLDICIERGWHYISLGDDFDLTLDKSVPGVNTTDAREVTLSFLDGVKKHLSGFQFIKVPDGHDKGKRLAKIVDMGLQDLYYSCVMPGRLHKSFKENTEKKFGIKLFGNNCGKCRKCCMHNLIMHYTKMKVLPDDYVSFCWDKMHSTGCKADYEFFKPELSLETRIANLFSY